MVPLFGKPIQRITFGSPAVLGGGPAPIHGGGGAGGGSGGGPIFHFPPEFAALTRDQQKAIYAIIHAANEGALRDAALEGVILDIPARVLDMARRESLVARGLDADLLRAAEARFEALPEFEPGRPGGLSGSGGPFARSHLRGPTMGPAAQATGVGSGGPMSIPSLTGPPRAAYSLSDLGLEADIDAHMGRPASSLGGASSVPPAPPAGAGLLRTNARGNLPARIAFNQFTIQPPSNPFSLPATPVIVPGPGQGGPINASSGQAASLFNNAVARQQNLPAVPIAQNPPGLQQALANAPLSVQRQYNMNRLRAVAAQVVTQANYNANNLPVAPAAPPVAPTGSGGGYRIPWSTIGGGLNAIGQVSLYSDLSVGVANQLADLNLRELNYAAYKLGQTTYPNINSPGITVTRVHPPGKPLDFVSAYSFSQQLAQQQYSAAAYARLMQLGGLSQQITLLQQQIAAGNTGLNPQLLSLQQQFLQTTIDLNTFGIGGQSAILQANSQLQQTQQQINNGGLGGGGGGGGSSLGYINQIPIQQQLAQQAQANPTGVVLVGGDDDVASTGDIKMTAGTAPTGWLECDGSAVSRTTYVDLFNVIGTTFGAGDASTTFNVPDMQGRVAVGRDPTNVRTSTPAVNIGSSGGANNYALNIAEMPMHNHAPAGASFVTNGAGSEYVHAAGALGVAQFVTANTGSGLAHNNMQPYLAFRYVIKT